MDKPEKKPLMPPKGKRPSMPPKEVQESMVPQRFDPKALGRVMRYMGAYKGCLVIVVTCILLSAIASAASSMFLQTLIDDYITPLLAMDVPVFTGLIRALITIACIYLVGAVSSLIYNRLTVTIAQGILKKIPMAKQCEIADKYIDLLQIKCASRETLIKQLSGGNQQKVILARWLATNPDFLILDEPTRGIDIGTKTEIQKLVLKLADEGKSLIFISSEIEEMLRTCNRMAVLRDGQKVGEIDEADMNQMNVMKAIAGGEQ